MKFFGKELKLLICDVDGVLLDLMACFPKNFCDAAEEFGVSTKPIKQYLHQVENGQNHEYASFSKCIEGLYPHLNDIEIQKFKEIFRQKDAENPYPPIEGSRVIIQMLSKSISIALCTTKGLPDLKHHLKYAGFDINWFSFTSSWETGHPKPDPRALTIITDSLQIPKENALFVGDWYPDWECSKSAGIEFVAVLSGGIPKHGFIAKGVPEDHIVNTLFDLVEIIDP